MFGGHPYVFFAKMSVQILWHFKIRFFFFDVELYTLYINPLPDISFANTLSHLIGGLFVLLVVSFVMQNFLVVCNPIYFCFCLPCLRRHIQKNIAKTDVKELTAYVFF